MNRPLGDREKAMVAAGRLAAHYGDAAMRAGADESEVHSNRKQAGSATEQGTSYFILTDVLLLGDHAGANWPMLRRSDRAATSYRNRFVPHQVEPDYLGRVLLIEMAQHGVPDHRFEVGPVISLRDDAMPERSGVVAALGSFGDFEDDLTAFHRGPFSGSDGKTG